MDFFTLYFFGEPRRSSGEEAAFAGVCAVAAAPRDAPAAKSADFKAPRRVRAPGSIPKGPMAEGKVDWLIIPNPVLPGPPSHARIPPRLRRGRGSGKNVMAATAPYRLQT